MAKLLRAPTEGYAEAIVVPPILAKQFELKHNLINMMTMDQFFGLEKENPHDHIRWFNKITSTIKYKDVPNSAIKLMLFPFSLVGEARRWLEKEPSRSIHTWEDLVSKFIKEFFPPSRTTNLRNEISNFQQRCDESFHEAWDRYKDLLHACPHHGGNLLERQTQDALTIIENKSKVRNSRSKSVVSQVKACDINSNSSSEIAKLTHVVNQQTSAMTTAMTAMLKQFQATPTSSFQLRDNIQGYVSAAAFNYNQGNLSYRPPDMANQIRPPGSGSLPSNTVANPKGELKAITTRSGLVIDGPTIPTPPQSINLEVDERVEETFTDPNLAEYTIKVPHLPVQKYKPPSQREYVVHPKDPLHPNIPYPSRMLKQKHQEKDEKILKALLSNKEKLQELANTPLNENCSAVILKKLPEKLGDPGKFLIPCGFTDFVIIDYESDPRVPLILGRPFLRTARALIDIHADFVIIDYESDPRVPLILGRPFLRTAHALIDIHGEEMILRDDFLKDLFSNQPSGNPTFSSHPELTSPEVNIFDSEGGNVLPKKLLDLDSTKDLHPPLHVNQLSGSTTYSLFSNPLLDELALITFPSKYDDDLQFDVESNLKEIKFLLYQDKDYSLKDSID
nr:hypothetical protein [Tanacetum cinerariifolium]